MPVSQVITSEKQPIKLWLDDLEEGTLLQAKNLANLPFIFRHVALMPDAHQGYGMPIGGVIATNETVIPNAVGVDIGCGMGAVRTSLSELGREQLKGLLAAVRRLIPLGFKHHKQRQDPALMPPLAASPNDEEMPVVAAEYLSALQQIGTLGGGNHFIEIQQGNDGRIWLMVHSGSRNLGLKVANYYNRLAIKLNRQAGSKIPAAWQLAFLPLADPTGQSYLREMNYCLEFARANRQLMMSRIQQALLQITPQATFEPLINIAHNYAAPEEHFGHRVMIHRKGATRARAGELGIIPGSQGSPSYIVRGLGNPESFHSCSHGAGRRMGRKEAQRSLNLASEQEHLERQGIIHAIRNSSDLDEATGAYKDIHRVMANQLDLVEVLVELRPLAVIKG